MKKHKSSSGLEKLAETAWRPRERTAGCGAGAVCLPAQCPQRRPGESSLPLLLKFHAISMAAFAVSVGLGLRALFLQVTCGVGVLEWWNLGAVS